MNNLVVLENLLTMRDYVRYAASRFCEEGLFFGHGTAGPIDEAAALVLHALHLPYDLPGGYFESRLIPSERSKVLDLINLRINQRKPLAYLTNEAPFAGLSFYVDERVLVPRSPLAELIADRFAPWVDPEKVSGILDLCTGSGCIAIACAFAFPDASVDAIDISSDALDVAKINVERHDLTDRLGLIQSDVYSAINGSQYDVIISNPPYVNSQEWASLPSEFHAEPRLGLESGADGLDCVKKILLGAMIHLRPKGVLIVEVGSAAEALEKAFPDVPFCWIDFASGGDGVFLLTYDQLVENFRTD
jgi:ribosomal protein L3 glutamine methyltransferase